MSTSLQSDKTNAVLSQNWDTYRFFLAVARSNSISQAALLLKESPPTVGRKITELETQLATKLFERNASGVKLTSCGEMILKNIQQIEHEAISLNELVRGKDKEMKGIVTVSSPVGFGQAVLAEKLSMLHDEYPDIHIELLLSTNQVNLLNREADIALRIGTPHQESLLGRKVGQVTFGIYVGREYLGYLDELELFKNIADLEGHNIIASAGSLSKTNQAIEFAEFSQKSQVVFSSDNLFVQLSAIKSGFGLAALPRYLGDADSELIEVLPGSLKNSADVWVLTHPDTKNIARVKTVREFIVNTVKEVI
jgi:DNA-binding transcriptional LysR family regulator